MMRVLFFLVLLDLRAAAPWNDDQYNLSPRSRTIIPKAIYRQNGAVSTSDALFPLTLSGPGSFVVLDFGREVGGFTTLQFGNTLTNGSVGLAYSESTNYAVCPSDSVAACADGAGQAGAGDHSNGGQGPDGTLSTGPLTSHTSFTPPVARMRGGFRYLNLFLEFGGTGSVEITSVSLHFTASPTMENPADYKNHFHSSDELLNRIWYGCAYTAQMCAIDSSHGRQWGPPTKGWNNAVVIGPGKTLLVDGAKRDRTVWPGDMGVSSATAFATLGDVESSRNSLDMLYALQDSTGQLPYVGPEVFCQKPWGGTCERAGTFASDTYHLWGLVGTSNVYQYTAHTGGQEWLSSIWSGYKRAVECSLAKVGTNALMRVDRKADWQRGGQGGFNVAANAILAHVLTDGAMLGRAMNDTAFAEKCSTQALRIREAMNALLWDDKVGAFIDNPDSKLHPQDGNSLMLWFNVTTADRAKRVSTYLQKNWSPIGAVSPEWIYNGRPAIGTFSGSMEVHGHAASGRADLAAELIRRQWGYMLNSPNSTNSTFWEGYQADGQYAFQGIYMSHAHGWASGPAAALSFHVLGLRPHHANGLGNASSYMVAPQFAGLEWCNGSLHFGDGQVAVSWAIAPGGAQYHVTVDATQHPHGVGKIGLPHLMADGLTASLPRIRVQTENSVVSRKETDAISGGRVWYELQGGIARFEVSAAAAEALV